MSKTRKLKRLLEKGINEYNGVSIIELMGEIAQKHQVEMKHHDTNIKNKRQEMKDEKRRIDDVSYAETHYDFREKHQKEFLKCFHYIPDAYELRMFSKSDDRRSFADMGIE